MCHRISPSRRPMSLTLSLFSEHRKMNSRQKLSSIYCPLAKKPMRGSIGFAFGWLALILPVTTIFSITILAVRVSLDGWGDGDTLFFAINLALVMLHWITLIVALIHAWPPCNACVNRIAYGTVYCCCCYCCPTNEENM